MPLRTTLFIAAAITTLYLCGFLIVLVEDPVNQVVQVVGLLRAAGATAWAVWAVFFAGERIMRGLQRRNMEEFADELGVRRERRNGFSAAR